MQATLRAIGRCWFRFVLFYWICFTFPFPLDLVGLPFALVETEQQPTWMKAAADAYGEAFTWMGNQKDAACTWVGNRLLQADVIIQPTGSGDTLRAYLGCLCAAVIAAVLALLWTIVVQFVKKRNPETDLDGRLHLIVRPVVRFFLCGTLLSYGFAKVFPLQFAAPTSLRLGQQLGEMSPMGLLWTFMGFSPAYQMFTGSVEVLAGLLLTTRRTTLLGSLLTLAAMTQVFLLNLCFDVPVKLYSFHYLVMAIFLLTPELPRLIDVFLLGRAVEAVPLPPYFRSEKLNRLVPVFRSLLVVAMVGTQVLGSYNLWNEMYGGIPAPIIGLWEIVSMEVDKKEPPEEDPMRWRSLDFSNRKFVRLTGLKPPNTAYLIAWDTETKKLTLTNFREPSWSATFRYDVPEADRLDLDGSMDGKAIHATLKRAVEKRYELMNRGFNWIQELPYNR